MRDEPSVGHSAGWYPDPVGDHELRYHNGTNWTGDVSTDGVRHVSAIRPAGPEPTGTPALVLGIITLCAGWIPFVSVLAFITGLVAIVIGIRRRRYPSARSSADAGIVTGIVGIGFALVATWVAFLIVAAVERFDDPGPHTATLTECAEVDGITRATGTVTNDDDEDRSYTIEVSFDGERSQSVEVDDVAPGDTASFVVDEDFRFDDLDCRIESVRGPRPFGLDTPT